MQANTLKSDDSVPVLTSQRGGGVEVLISGKLQQVRLQESHVVRVQSLWRRLCRGDSRVCWVNEEHTFGSRGCGPAVSTSHLTP